MQEEAPELASRETTKRATASRKAKRGRTPSLDPERIERAVRAVGRRGPLTMQKVAAELAVDVTTLYRHVGGVDELRRIWARLSAPAVPGWPSPKGQTWPIWLSKMAHHLRDALRENPELVEHADAVLDADFEGLEQATRTLIEFGFEPREAFLAYSYLLNQLVGFLHQEIRNREDSERGFPNIARLYRALAGSPTDGRLPTLRSLDLRTKEFDGDSIFEVFLDFLIGGIRARPGAPPTNRKLRG